VTILIDTDVLVDVALDRLPFAAAAGALLDALERRPNSGFVAWHTVSNFYYLVAAARGRKASLDFLLDLTRFVRVAPATTQAMRYAATLPMGDFEDAMQVAAAEACAADAIATRNTRDYKASPIRAARPEMLVVELERRDWRPTPESPGPPGRSRR